MEGISGIRFMDQVFRDKPDYAEGVLLMTQEINLAVAAAFEAGATQVVVNDCHGGGNNVKASQLDPRAHFESPASGKICPSLDASFAGLILLGHHARAGTQLGFLDHTMDSSSWFEYRINGKEVGEIAIEAAWAGHHDVPVILVVGDEACAREAQADLLGVHTVAVKRAISRNCASTPPLAQAHQRVREGIKTAIANRANVKPYKPQCPGTIELTCYRTDQAEVLAARPGCERISGRTVRRHFTSLLDICRW